MKGVIIAAGYGTRFLPVTKTVPKEMLPIVDTPAIDYVLDEFEKAGIRDVIIVTSRRKKSLDDYFDREIELENIFTSENKPDKLDKIKPREGMHFSFIRQQKMLGTGNAILLLKNLTGSEPFIVAYPDDLFTGGNVSSLLMEIYNNTGKGVLAVEQQEGDVSSYGVVEVSCAGSTGGIMRLNRLVEKPPKGKEPSKLVSVGRYLFTPDIYEHLETGWKNHTGGEYYHVYAINQLAAEDKLLCGVVQGKRYDTGTPIKYLETVIDFALAREDIGEEIKQLILKKATQLS